MHPAPALPLTGTSTFLERHLRGMRAARALFERRAAAKMASSDASR